MNEAQIPDEDLLEAQFAKAAKDPGERPAFLRMLMGSRVWVITPDSATDEDESVQLHADDELAICNFEGNQGRQFIPFFSKRRYAADFAGSNVHVLGLMVKDLFEITQGAHLVFNPGQSVAKDFLPEEISDLLQPQRKMTSRTVEEETTILVSQPKPYPQQMINALSTLFEQYAEIIQAYYAIIIVPSANEPSPGLMGLEVTNDCSDERFEEILADVSQVLRDTSDRATDIVRMDADIVQFFKNTEPFYCTEQ